LSQFFYSSFSINGIGKTWIKNPEKINKISALIKLMEEKAEPYEFFVDNPKFTRFKIELYKKEKLLHQIRIAEHFIRRNDEWYWTGDMCLAEELIKYTKGLRLKKPSCAFV